MTGSRIQRLTGALALALAVALAGGSSAQALPPPAPAAPDAHGLAEDRVFALVQAGKCAQARAAALQADDPGLADQIGLMCGAKPSGASSRGEGGGRGGGAGGGRRGGG